MDRWRRTRDEIHHQVCANADDPERTTFPESYGSRELDASLLLMALVGLLAPSDPRVRAPSKPSRGSCSRTGWCCAPPPRRPGEAVGWLPGREGAFLACSFRLADNNYALVGRTDDAHRLFRRLLELRNDVGLLAERIRPGRQPAAGNVPQPSPTCP